MSRDYIRSTDYRLGQRERAARARMHADVRSDPAPDRRSHPQSRSAGERGLRMELKPDRLAAQLAAEPLRQICGRTRAAAGTRGRRRVRRARANGYGEREVFAPRQFRRFRWNEPPRLFSARQLLELRLPGGKPGRAPGCSPGYCARPPEDVVLRLSGDWSRARRKMERAIARQPLRACAAGAPARARRGSNRLRQRGVRADKRQCSAWPSGSRATCWRPRRKWAGCWRWRALDAARVDHWDRPARFDVTLWCGPAAQRRQAARIRGCRGERSGADGHGGDGLNRSRVARVRAARNLATEFGRSGWESNRRCTGALASFGAALGAVRRW